ncbi:putative Glyco_trans_2-like domain-containing protein [Candidatus Hydrogenisulfobacillus filiaventi]|uniref:Putative Glyco_trans_2-like domain-containing protein n=1 Tax=Candidatus Hydrogenisulfobacillus filiaventi TaxID=2707344 RepID=A0A6F8ZCQ4_9FIRM|nr:putative Glyco_trans_2-like domain-containing protein [Candidatus Hydrogenisulfobacillus filiaventi]
MISVIIPAFNAGPWITACLDSVWPWEEAEIVIVDDASVDDTAARLEAYLASRPREGVTLLRNADNLGPAAARNRGIAAARGDWVLFLDADNWVLPAIRPFSRTLDSQQAPMVFSEMLVAEGSTLTGAWYYRDVQRLDPAALLASQPEVILLRNYIDVFAFVARPVLDLERFDAAVLPGLEDWDLWVRLLLRGIRPRFVPEPLGVYRIRDGSLTIRQQADIHLQSARHLQLWARNLGRAEGQPEMQAAIAVAVARQCRRLLEEG